MTQITYSITAVVDHYITTKSIAIFRELALHLQPIIDIKSATHIITAGSAPGDIVT